MRRAFIRYIKSLSNAITTISGQFKNQHAYELKSILACDETGKHRIEAKLSGKAQSLTFTAEEIAADQTFLLGFSPSDIRTIVYLATSDKYEAILEAEKLKKTIEIYRSKNMDGKKAVQFKDKITGKIIIKRLKDFSDIEIIDRLTSHEAYKLGFLAGEEQAMASAMCLKIIANDKEKSDE